MTCFTYNNINYSFDEFANLLLSGELETLALQKRIDINLSSISKSISNDIKNIETKFNRKISIEKTKYKAALNSSDDLIKLGNFYKKNPVKNTKLPDDVVKKQASLSQGADVSELKKTLSSINKAWKQTEALLAAAKESEITIASQKPVVAKNKFELKPILRNLFNLKKVFKTKDNKTISQDEAAATLMDKVLNTIAQRRSQTEGVPVTAQDIYNNTFYKRSTPEEIKASLNILNQLIGKEAAKKDKKLNAYLEEALSLKSAGISDKTIYQLTNWELGKDGKWRYDLKDELNFLNVKDKIASLKSGTQTLYQLFGESKLFNLYPSLKDVQVFIDNTNYQPGNSASYANLHTGSFLDPSMTLLLLNNDITSDQFIFFTGTPSEEYFTKGLLHEIQHAIQDIEGFDSGGNLTTLSRLFRNVKVEEGEKRYEKQEELIKTIKEVINNLTPQDLAKLNITPTILEQAKKDFAEAVENYKFGIGFIPYGGVGFENLSFVVYRLLSGEIEAANVVNRYFMTNEERDRVAISATEDIERSRQFSSINEGDIKLQLIGKEGIKNLGIPFTETFIDVAGNNRYELSNFDTKIQFTAQDIQTLINKLKKGVPLKEVFFHEKLFRAYPQLMDLKVEMKAFSDSRNRGVYKGVESIFDNKVASIVLNSKDINGNEITNLQDTFTTLIHEVQHAIQHIERIDPGTSIESVLESIEKDKEATILLIDRLEEAKAKNLTLGSLLSEQDLEVISESFNSIDNINAVPEEDVISYFKEHLRKVKNLTKGDVVTMYTNSLGELEAETVEARSDFEKIFLECISFTNMMKTRASLRDPQGIILKNPIDAFFIVLDQRNAKESPVLFQTIVNNNATPDGVNSIIDASFNKALLTLKVEELANKNKSEVTTLPTLTADEQKLALKIKERVPKVGRKNTPLDPLFKQDWNTGIFSYDEIYLSPFVASDKEDREQIEKFLYNYLIQLNPVLKNIPITLNNKVKFKSPFTKMADIIAGVGSQGLYEDIRFFVEDLNGTLQNKTKKYEKEKSTLEFRLGRNLYYGISPNTISEINKEFNSKGVLFFQAARAAYQSDGSFSIGGGRFDILKEGQDIIHAITDPNVSSPLHEVTHKFEKYLTPEERAIVLSFAETPTWTTATSEKFARGFEKYLAEGKAPTSALQDIFDAFANWLMAIYNGIVNSEIDITLNDEMRQIYDAMLGVEKAAPVAANTQTNTASTNVITPTNTPIKQAITSAKILGQKLLNKIKLAAKSNEWVSSMPISKEDFTKLEDATKRLSVKDMGEVTSNSEVIPDILLIEEINAKYDAELKAETTTPTTPNQSKIKDKKADIKIGKVGNTEYEVKSDGVYYQNKKLDNPENKTHRQLIEADIERRRQEDLEKTNAQLETIEKNGDSFIRVKVEVYTTLSNEETLNEVEIITFKDGSRRIRATDAKTGEIVLEEKIKKDNSTTNEKFIESFIGNLDNSLKKISEDNNPNKTAIDKIYAKYDTELKALEQSLKETTKEETTPTTSNQSEIAEIERRRQELESSREIETLYDLRKPIAEDSKEIIFKIEEANELRKNAQIKYEQAAKETDEEKKIALNSIAISLDEKAQILDKEVKASRDSVINNTPIDVVSTNDALKDVESTTKALKDNKIPEELADELEDTYLRETGEYQNWFTKIGDSLFIKSKGFTDLKSLTQQLLRAKGIDPILFNKERNEFLNNNESLIVAEAYHKFKTGNSNPELVKAVEAALTYTTERKEPLIETVKGENPYSTASQLEMSDALRLKFDNISSEQLLEQINLGTIEAIKTTDTSNLYILKGEQNPFFSEYGGSLEDATETAILDKQNQDATANSLIEQYKALKANEKTNTENPTDNRQTEATPQSIETEIIQQDVEPKIENVSFDKELIRESKKVEEPIKTEDLQIEDEESFVQPAVTEKAEELAVESITEYNGYVVGDKVLIDNNVYKIRTFSKLSGDYIVGASLMSGRFAAKSVDFFNASSIKPLQEEKTETPRFVYTPVKEIPKVDDLVTTVDNRDYVVKKVDTVKGELIVTEIVPGLEGDEILDFIPISSVSKINKSSNKSSEPKPKSAKQKKKEMLLTILRYMSDMFDPQKDKSIPYEIVDRPGENWAGSFKNGKVYINLSMAEKDTPIHEFLHPFVYVLSKENPELYNSLLKEMKTEVTSNFITKEKGLFFIKNNDSLYGDSRGYASKKDAENDIVNINNNIYNSYKKNKELIEKEDFYINTSLAEQQEEILVRVLTERIVSVFEDSGIINREKADDLYKRSSSFMSTFVEMMLMYIDKFVGFITSAIKGTSASNSLSRIKSSEYNPITGSFRIYKEGRDKALTAFIGKNGEKLKTGAIKVLLKDSFRNESDENINNFILDIDAELNGIRNDNDDVDVELDDRGYYVLSSQVSKNNSFIPTLERRRVADGLNSYVDSKFLSSDILTTGKGTKKVDFITMPHNVTIENIAAMITNRGLYAIDLSNHKKDFEKLSDKFYVKTPEDLTKFANTFRKKLLALKNTIESRLKESDLTEDARNTIIRNLQQIKPLLDENFLKDNDFTDITVSIIKTGFESLMAAEQMMHKIRTKINYGDVNTYVEEFEKRLINAGIDIEYKPKNIFAIRLKKGKVILNKKMLIDSGVVPFDIAKNVVGDIDSQRDFVNTVQKIHSTLLKEMETKTLSQEDIKKLNWEISTLRNYYATFSGFTRSLLKEYMEHLDYSTEYMEFSNTLVEAGLRMKELEIDMKKLAVDWLFPEFDKLQNNALASLSKKEREEKYIDKTRFTKLVSHADADLTKLFYLFGTIVNTSDPINATVSIIISDVINNNKTILGHLVSQSKSLKETYFKTKGLNNTQQRAEYIKNNFLRKVKVYEVEKDEYNNTVLINGEPKKNIIERWAIHTEYKEDEFELAREIFIKTLVKPVAPVERTPQAWTDYLEDRKDYREAIEKWSIENKENFRNATFDKLIKTDEAFQFLYNNYIYANDKYGELKLQYGIIPQAFLESSFLENVKKQRSSIQEFISRFKDKNRPIVEKVLGSVKAASNYLLNSENEQEYARINPDGTLYRSIKTQYLRKLDESDLNFDLMDTVVGFSEDAFRYSSLRDIQANVENLRLLINGYSQGAISPRTVPKLDSNNQLIWDSTIGQTNVKSAIDNRLNKQLNSFIDDIFYGDTNKPSRINLYSSSNYKINLAKAKRMISEGKSKEDIYKETTFYLEKDTNQWKSDEYANVSVSLNKFAQNATFYTSALSLAFNVMSTARNLTIGNFTNYSEAFGGKYYKEKEFWKAQKLYAQTIPDNIKGFVSKDKNKLNQILFDYQAIQGEFRDRYNKLVTDESTIARLFSKDSLFFLQHVAEHQIQGTATLALMLSTNVKLKDGTSVNLWDAHELDEKGVLKLRDDVVDFDKIRFVRNLHEMNRSNHGNYSNLHKTVIQREWYGSLLMTFRKHMYPTLKARFGKKTIDYSKEAETEGFHRLFWRKVSEDVMKYGFQLNKYDVFSKDKRNEWSQEEQYSFKRSLMETFFSIIPLMILALVLGGDDDETDSTVKKWLMVLTNGLYTDVAVTNPLGIYNPFVNQSEIYQEIKKITTNPVAVQYSFKKIADFFNELTKESSEDKDVYGKFGKIIPMVKHIDFFTNSDDYISGYLKYQSLIGSGVK